MKLTIIANGIRIARDMNPQEVIAAASILKSNSRYFAVVPLTVLLEDGNGITHIICRRGAME